MKVLNSTTFPGLASSCKQPLNAVTEKEQVAVLPLASVAVQVTVVVPMGKGDPDGGLQEVVTPGQLSLAVGGGNETGVAAEGGQVGAATAVTFAGQVIEGGWVSFTRTVNVQVGPANVDAVTVVMPTGKKLPEAGWTDTVTLAVQLSVAVTV